MANVSLRDINKIYDGGFQAVYDFNLEIEDGEFVVFVGPSGCGKSTTLRMVAGLEDITSGELYIGDDLVNDVEPKERDIAMVFQNYALYPHMSVKENMSYALKIKKESKSVIDEKVQKAAEILGLSQVLDRKPKALSGGQKQRVALGRAIVRNPKVFLMDEPLSNLDAKLRVQTRAEIIRLHETLATTFIYVTHDQTEAMTMGDRIVVMDHGRIQQVDTPHNVYFYPANVFVAGFIGSPQMNFFPTKVKKLEEGYSFDILGESKRLPERYGLELEKVGKLDEKLILGIRPEHIYSQDRPTSLQIASDVNLVELLGSEKHLHCQIGETEFLARINSDNDVATKDRITLYFDEEKMHFFDAETKENISLNAIRVKAQSEE